jgi:RHS repeat-associated protein
VRVVRGVELPVLNPQRIRSVTRALKVRAYNGGTMLEVHVEVEYAIFLDTAANVAVYESGNFRGYFGNYAGGDRFRVAVESGAVKYYRNGTLFYTSTVTPQYPLLVDTSLNTVYAGVYNVVITSTSPSANGNINWLVGDQLGTPRMVFDKTGSLANVKRHDYLPFGEELNAGTGSRSTALGFTGDAIRQKFTSKERDNESGLDYFEARYYGSAYGRFTSPDPLGGHTEDPQTLNAYTYVRNNPQRFTDPSGLDFYLACDGNTATCQGGRVGQTDQKGTFTATIISNDKKGGLVDQYGNKYTTQINGQGVSFSGAGCDEFIQGVFLNGTNATTIQGSGDLTGFTFNFTYSNLNADVTAGGTFSFNGTSERTSQALEKAGFHNYAADELNFFHMGKEDFRSLGNTKGDGAGHFAVLSFDSVPVPDSGYEKVRRTTVPTTGDMHFGETNPWTSLRALLKHAGQVKRSISHSIFRP